MNVISYIKKFGKYTFDERHFSDVDALIISALSMMSFDDYVKETGEITLKDIKISKISDDIFYESPDRKFNRAQLVEMIKSKRFKNLTIKNIKRIFSSEEPNQFYAMTVVLPNDILFLAFRGTDITLVGWKEDFILASKDTIMSQVEALEYTREVVSKCDNRFYLAGHSKGGNIAFYSALNLEDKYLERLIRAYSFDGPGFKVDMKLFPAYDKAIHKLTKYRTYYNMIGAMFNQMKRYTVVYSNGLLLGGHDLYYWQINPYNGKFKLANDVSPFSKVYSARFMSWVDSVELNDRELATDAFFKILKDCETIYDLPTKAPADLLNAKKVLMEYPEESRSRIDKIVKRLVKYLLTPISSNKKDEKNKNSIR